MTEIYSLDRSRYIGSFASFKAAKGVLENCLVSGELKKPCILVCSYKNKELIREQIAYYCQKWRFIPAGKKRKPAQRTKKKARRGGKRCKAYKSPEDCFREGFPDWLNKVYQPVR